MPQKSWCPPTVWKKVHRAEDTEQTISHGSEGRTEPATAAHANAKVCAVRQDTAAVPVIKPRVATTTRAELATALLLIASSFLPCGISHVTFSCINSLVTCRWRSEWQRDLDWRVQGMYTRWHCYLSLREDSGKGMENTPSSSSHGQQSGRMTQKVMTQKKRKRKLW